MGADVIGWRSCALQEELQPEGFLGKLKLKMYKNAIEAQLPEAQRDGAKVVVRVTGRPDRNLDYRQICDEVAAFAAGIPACAECPLSGGAPLGCYRYLTYPVDEAAERMLFEFFTETMSDEASVAAVIYRVVASRIDPKESAWTEMRGGDGGLAALPKPLSHKWGKRKSERVTSAQVLEALLQTLDTANAVEGYAVFWLEFFQWLDRKLARSGVSLEGDRLEIKIEVGGDGEVDAKAVAKKATDALALTADYARSKTLDELRDVGDLLLAMARAKQPDWTLLVDG